MQHDEMIWQVINHQFCSFKTKIGVALSEKREFCKHPYSITGLCNRSSCPLANSHYATIKEEDGRIHLYIKTVERAHSPKNLWEKIYLSRNYTKAMGQLDEHLAYFPKAMVHRNKQRLTKIHQYLLRMRKLKLREINGRKANMTRVHRKVEQREERREKKALVAAKIETNIEKELMERLAKGTYGDIYNFPEVPYQKALESMIEKEEEQEENEEDTETENEDDEEEEEQEEMIEYVEDLDEDEDDIEDIDIDAWGENSYDDSENDDESSNEEESISLDEEGQGVSDDDNGDDSTEDGEDDDDDDDNDDDSSPEKKRPKKSTKRKRTPRARGTRVEIEYEDENEPIQNSLSEFEAGSAGMAW